MRPGPRYRPRRKPGARDMRVGVLRALRLMMVGPVSVERLQLELGVSRRTVYNYVSAIRIAGGLLRTEPGEGYLLDGWVYP
jgi:biotin operon repressor